MPTYSRPIRETAAAALIAYAHSGSATEIVARELTATGKPVSTIDHPANAALLARGAERYAHL